MAIIVKKKRTLRERAKEVDQKLALSEGRRRDLNQSERGYDPKTREFFGNISSSAFVQKHHSIINDYIKSVSNMTVHYKFHESSENRIADHVRQQLQDRVIKATPDEKDLFFLTAFLDRNALDNYVQDFRKNHPYFKEELVQCWNENSTVLSKVTQNIENTINRFKNGFEIECTPFMEKLYSEVPGKSKLNQFLICLKIIKDVYKLNKNTNISQTIQNVMQERHLRKYLLSLYGVGYKLANWSITNVTGHWFVIDMHIEKAINEYLKYALLNEKAKADNADKIFSGWFGILDEYKHQFSLISQKQFTSIFPNFLPSECEYLPFIMTQYLWFHGKYFVSEVPN
jgi:hypothetical protein